MSFSQADGKERRPPTILVTMVPGRLAKWRLQKRQLVVLTRAEARLLCQALPGSELSRSLRRRRRSGRWYKQLRCESLSSTCGDPRSAAARRGCRLPSTSGGRCSVEDPQRWRPRRGARLVRAYFVTSFAPLLRSYDCGATSAPCCALFFAPLSAARRVQGCLHQSAAVARCVAMQNGKCKCPGSIVQPSLVD